MNSESLKLVFSEHQRLMKQLADYLGDSLDLNGIPKFEKLEGPQLFQSLPTVHIIRHVREYLTETVEEAHAMFCSEESNSKTIPEPVRPIFTHLELQVSMCILYNEWRTALKGLTVICRVAQCSRRVYDEWGALALMALILVEQDEVERASEVVASLPEDTPHPCPESKAFIIALARLVCQAYTSEIEAGKESAMVKLSVLSSTYAPFFATKTTGALWSHGFLLIWQIRLRLRVGDPALLSEASLLDMAQTLRKIGYSLVKFLFGAGMVATKGEKDSTLVNGWNSVHLMLEGCYLVCYIYTFIGVSREARCYLREFMKMCQRFYLPWRTTQCLTLMAHVDNLSQQFGFLKTRLDSLDYVAISTLERTSAVTGGGRNDGDLDSDEDGGFIRSTIPAGGGNEEEKDDLMEKASTLPPSIEQTSSSPPLNRLNINRDKNRPIADIYRDCGYEWLTTARRIVEERVLSSATFNSPLLVGPPLIDDNVQEENENVQVDVKKDSPPLPLQCGSLDVCDDLICALNQFKTPPLKEEDTTSVVGTRRPPTRVSGAPRRPKLEDLCPPSSGIITRKEKTTTGRPRRGRSKREAAPVDTEVKTLRKDLQVDDLTVYLGLTSISTENESGSRVLGTNRAGGGIRLTGKGKKILVDNTCRNVKKSLKPIIYQPEFEEEEDESIEQCPSVPFIPRNVRQRMHHKPRGGDGMLQFGSPSSRSTTEAVANRRRGEIQMDIKLNTEANKPTLPMDPVARKDLQTQLEQAYRLMRWMPVPHMFRPLCHLLALLALEREDGLSAAYYLSQAIFIAFRVTYASTIHSKSRDTTNGARWKGALEAYRLSIRDIPSWREAVTSLPPDWLTLQFTLIDEVAGGNNGTTGTVLPCYLLVTRIRAGQQPDTRVIHGFTPTGRAYLNEFEEIMIENIQSMSETNQRKWWCSRYDLNDKLESILKKMRNRWFSQEDMTWMFGDQKPESLVVLILDRVLNNLPWEWLLLDDHPCLTRQPCLSVSLAHLSLVRPRLASGMDLRHGFYVVNPDSNLSSTQASLLPLLADGGMDWTGIVGRWPTEKELFTGLRLNDVFTYCGHGCGCKYLYLQNLQSSTSRAVALLIGCSSSRFKMEGLYEPFAAFLSHLTAGSPCVLGLLWDVTDKDIDRYSMKLLGDWKLPSNKTQFSRLMREARSACKMDHLVGKSPVVYGFPLDKTDALQPLGTL